MVQPTTVVTCQTCDHPINSHVGREGCTQVAFGGCDCILEPNDIAVAAVRNALFGELTPMPGRS